MARPTRRLGSEAKHAWIHRSILFALVVSIVAPVVWPRLAGTRHHVPFARTKLPGLFQDERPLVVQFAPDGERVFVVGRDALRVYASADLARGEATPLYTVDHTENGFTFEGTSLAALSGNGRELVVVRTLAKGVELDVIALERSGLLQAIRIEPATSIAVSSNGMQALVGSSRVELWDLARGTRAGVLEVQGGPVRGIRFSPDDQRAVFECSGTPRTMTWDLTSQTTRETGAALRPALFAGGASRVFGFARAGASGKTAAGAGPVLWDPERGETVAIDGGSAAIEDATRLGGGPRIAGVADQQVVVWDLDARTPGRAIGGAKPDLGRFEGVCSTPRGDAVVIATHAGELLWLDVGG